MYVLQGGIALVVRRGDIETGSKSVSSAFSEREEEMNAFPTTVLNTSCTCLLNPRFDHQVPLSLVSSLVIHIYMLAFVSATTFIPWIGFFIQVVLG